MGARTVDEETIRRWISEGSPSPAGGSLLSETVELTDAQIKALPSTKVLLVAAQGSNKAVIPVSCIAISNFTGGAYTHDAGASWQLTLQDGTTIGAPFVADTALDDATNIYINQIACIDQGPGGGDFTGVLVTGSAALVGSYNNKGIYLSDSFNGIDDYTVGNAANTLKVVLYYIVVDL